VEVKWSWVSEALPGPASTPCTAEPQRCVGSMDPTPGSMDPSFPPSSSSTSGASPHGAAVVVPRLGAWEHGGKGEDAASGLPAPRGDGYRSSSACSSGRSSPDQSSSDFSDDDDGVEGKPDSAYDPPCTLRVDYWKRSPEVQQRKDSHIAHIDAGGVSREERIYRTTLRDGDIALEENMFPYDCPRGIRHYTLWSCEELSHRDICRFIEGHCHRHLPGQVLKWNYEENSHRSIDIPHVHVFLQFKQGEGHHQDMKLGKLKRSSTAMLADACRPRPQTPLCSAAAAASLECDADYTDAGGATEPPIEEGGGRQGKRPRHQ